MAKPITKQQLDALERAADKVFGNLGIDIEFTRHFIDRANDERNREQITIRELGELFVKEYKRWGRKIASMPIDSQAVMKDLSSELNIPFILDKDGDEKDLVAKTVMRKKNFHTTNPELPVESVTEDNDFEFKGRKRGTSTWESSDGRKVQLSTWNDYKKTGRNSRLRDPSGTKWKLQIHENGQEVFYKVVGKAEDMESWPRKQRAVKAALKFLNKEYGIDAYEQLWIEGGLPQPENWGEVKETPHPMRGKLVGEGIGDNFIRAKTFAEIMALKTDAELAKNYQEYVVNGGKGKTLHPRKLKQVQQAINYEIARRKEHDEINEESGKQTWDVVANGTGKILATFDNKRLAPQHYWVQKGWATIKPNRGGVKGERYIEETVGSDRDFVQSFVKDRRREGWSVYVSRMNHRNRGDYRLEFEKDGNEFEVIGQGNNWELYRGPTLSGNAEMFDGLDAAFQTGTYQSESMDEPPLDVETPTPATIAARHDVDLDFIERELKKGIEIEMEHTTDAFAAMEIALDHLNEMPDYYRKMATIEPRHYTDESVKSAWESYQQLDELIDPREAILQKALKYLDKKVQMGHGRQSLGGYAFEVAREVNLQGIATAKDLAQLYRDWKGDSVVTEGWMESSLYYLDEVIREDEDPCWDGYEQIGMKKKNGKQVPNCVPKKKKK